MSKYRCQDNGRRSSDRITVRTSKGDRSYSMASLNREPRAFRAHRPTTSEMQAHIAEECRFRTSWRGSF